MKLQVEFDHGGRTYSVESPNIQMWNVHVIAKMNGSMSIETDLRTGERIFVTWSQVGVIRLISAVDEKGFAVSRGGSPGDTSDGETIVGAPATVLSSFDTQTPRNTTTTAGWYPDPDRPAGSFQRRYWDGNAWTDQFD